MGGMCGLLAGFCADAYSYVSPRGRARGAALEGIAALLHVTSTGRVRLPYFTVLAVLAVLARQIQYGRLRKKIAIR